VPWSAATLAHHIFFLVGRSPPNSNEARVHGTDADACLFLLLRSLFAPAPTTSYVAYGESSSFSRANITQHCDWTPSVGLREQGVDASFLSLVIIIGVVKLVRACVRACVRVRAYLRAGDVALHAA
jgi:hypothetical protein